MNKKEFMQKLKDSLIGLNQTDKREVLLDYEEHFMDGKNQGRTEEEICQSLGDPKEIAKEIKSQSQLSAPNNDGVNTAGYIIGIILLGGACLLLASVLFSVVTAAIGGVFGAVTVATVFANPMLKVASLSGIIFTISLCVLIALIIIKLIPLIIKWFKQMLYSLDNKPEKAKAVEYKKIKIHAVIWILVGVICVASICGMIVGGVGFAKEVVTDLDAEEIYEFSDVIRELSYNHGHWGYYGYGMNGFENAMEDFADDMEDFADDMEDFADDMEDTFDHDRHWFFGWKYVFD
jgi:HAAS domain-containing protein